MEEEKASIKDMTLEKLEDFGVLCKVGRDRYPTHAFGLLTDNHNKAAKIQCALFKGTSRDIFINQKEFIGPIQKLDRYCIQVCIFDDRTDGKFVIPAAAYRKEGLSYHYAASADYIEIKNAKVVKAILDELNLPSVIGKIWTTDAIYRETKAKREVRKMKAA